MEVKKISPQGYCKGVILALKKCLDATSDTSLPQPIYLLGMPIHNKKVSEALSAKGLIILDGKTRLEMLDDISSGTIIISAHGASKRVFDKAKAKGLTIIDATCESVKAIQNTLRNTSKHILYIGINNHPESEAILDEFEDVTLIENMDDIKKIDPNKAYFATNQTTMSIYDTQDKYQSLINLGLEIETKNMICYATTDRQKALKDIKADLIIIVGDKRSSNTHKLYELALKQAESKLVLKVETVNDLTNINLTEYNMAYVTSGASTPKKITDEVIEYLKNYPNKKAISTLMLDDYLSF